MHCAGCSEVFKNDSGASKGLSTENSSLQTRPPPPPNRRGPRWLDPDIRALRPLTVNGFCTTGGTKGNNLTESHRKFSKTRGSHCPHIAGQRNRSDHWILIGTAAVRGPTGMTLIIKRSCSCHSLVTCGTFNGLIA